MTNVDLLAAVQPPDGWFAIVGIRGTRDVKQELVATREEADELIARFVAENRNVFFGVAKYETNENRKKENVLGLKAFWVDIDCGPTKAEVDPKTNRPDGYVDQAAGLDALRNFCKLVGLPRPLLVNSGRGIHAYWPLTDTVSREDWEPVAARLNELCVTHDFYVDPSVFEVARILRVPDTFNFKDDPPKPVTIMAAAPPVEFEEFRKILGVKPRTELVIPERRVSNLGKKLMDDSLSRFSKIMRRSAEGNGCQQLVSCFKERATLSEVRWFDALSVAKFCVDRDSAIQKLSAGHPDYDPMRVLEKIRHIQGPHNCVTFERNNPGGCDGCPFKDKIKNPIVLGKEIIESEAEGEEYVVEVEGDDEEEVVDYKIPVYPEPFFRGKTGGIYVRPTKKDEEAEPELVYIHDLYVVKIMTDPKDEGDVVVMRLHLPMEGIREFTIPMRQAVGDVAELRKALANKGVACTKKQFDYLSLFMIYSIDRIQHKRKAERMRLQFGWADNNSKFIVGDREITKDGIFHSPPSSTTQGLAERMTPRGSYEKWKEIFNLYGREGLEPHAFAALSAFGAPLFKFTGQSGAIINVIHPNSGTGKTTILHMCNSVWGHPKDLCAVKEDTANAKTMHLGVMNNLPFTVDEMTNMSEAAFSEMAYNMSQGRGKNRMKASGNELRLNSTTWQTISVCSSNSSFYEKLTKLKKRPDGEMMRLLEYKIDYTTSLPTEFAKEMFDHQLMEHYGHAGLIYMQWVLNNLEEVRATIKAIQAKIDRELKLTQRERFWSATLAANITGGLIAHRLGIIDWDMKRIYKWVTTMINETRNDTKAPLDSAIMVLGDYLNRHIHNVAVINDKVDKRSNMEPFPIMEPKGELLIRYEPDTKRIYMTAKPFMDDCVKSQINYKDTLKDLKQRGVYLGGDTKRLGKGLKVASGPVYCLEFDVSGGDFFDVNEFVTNSAEAADAGGRS